MAARWGWVLLTAIAPIAWGSNYYVTRHALPSDHALYGALLRALPAGLLLLAVRPRLPRGAWWWRSVVLGALNVGAFFALIYVAAQLLPTNVASMVMAASPVALMLFAWALLRGPPRVLQLAGAALGIGGVLVMLGVGASSIDPAGVLASLAAMVMSSVGYVLTRRWGSEVDVVALTAWQLIAGGLLLAPAAVVVEGAPPALDSAAVLGFGSTPGRPAEGSGPPPSARTSGRPRLRGRGDAAWRARRRPSG